MAVTYKFFNTVFASTGQVAPVPDQAQPDQTLSYSEGFTSRYSQPYPDSPGSLAIPRNEVNELFKDVTGALQQYQSVGVPEFVGSDDNLGVPFAYSKNSVALYDAQDGSGTRFFRSNKNNNTQTPTIASGVSTPSANWDLINDSASRLILNHVDISPSSPVTLGSVVCINPTTGLFELALANGTFSQNFVGICDPVNQQVYMSGLFELFPGNLTPASLYYLSETVYGAITTYAGTINSVPVGIAISNSKLLILPGYGGQYASKNYGLPIGSIVAYGSPSIPSGFLLCNGAAVPRAGYPGLFSIIGTTWGSGDGVSTFNLPDLSRRQIIGSGGVKDIYSNINITVGSMGGAESRVITIANMPAHAHPGTLNLVNRSEPVIDSTAYIADLIPVGRHIISGQSWQAPVSSTIVGSGANLFTMDPTAVVNFLIKY